MEYLKAWLFKEQALAKQGKKIHTEDEKTFLKYLEKMLTQVQSLMDTKLIRRTKTGNFELAEVAELQVQVRELQEENKKLKECVEFYAVNGLAKPEPGTLIDERLAQEFYVAGGFARKTLGELKC